MEGIQLPRDASNNCCPQSFLDMPVGDTKDVVSPAVLSAMLYGCMVGTRGMTKDLVVRPLTLYTDFAYLRLFFCLHLHKCTHTAITLHCVYHSRSLVKMHTPRTHAHTHTHTHTHAHTRAHTHIHTHTHVHTHTRTRTHTHTHTHIHARAHTHTHVHTYTHVHTHTLTHTHMCTRTHMHTHMLSKSDCHHLAVFGMNAIHFLKDRRRKVTSTSLGKSRATGHGRSKYLLKVGTGKLSAHVHVCVCVIGACCFSQGSWERGEHSVV